MMSVKKVSELSGVSIRTLHYYDEIGLLKPTEISENGYRYYDNESLERLKQIILLRTLEFPLKEINAVLDCTNLERGKIIESQIELLTQKKEHLENVLNLARWIKAVGVRAVGFSAFDLEKFNEYSKTAKEKWGSTDEYKEFEQKNKNRTQQDEMQLEEDMMTIMAEFGQMKDNPPESEVVQNQVRRLQDFITENCYTCTPKILRLLGKMYAGGGDFTENIDNVGGVGTADFICKAIDVYTSEL